METSLFTTEQVEWLNKHRVSNTIPRLTELFNTAFNQTRSIKGIGRRVRRNGPTIVGPTHWTGPQETFLRNNYDHCTIREIVHLYNNNFEIPRTNKSIIRKTEVMKLGGHKINQYGRAYADTLTETEKTYIHENYLLETDRTMGVNFSLPPSAIGAYRKSKELIRPITTKEERIDARRNRQQHHRDTIKKMKAKSGCIICDEQNPTVLDYHHKDPSTKLFEIGVGNSSNSPRLLEEINKCVCICSNHHRMLHAGEIKL